MDIEIPQGASWHWELVWADDTPEQTPLDLTDYTARMQVRTRYAELEADPAEPPLAEFSTDTGEIVITGDEGKIVFDVGYDVTEELPSGRYYFDVEVTSDTDFRTRLVSGRVYVSPEVTR